MDKKVCIIGAGGSGMISAKACLEEGIDIVVYERTDKTGGLWRYRDEDDDGVASVMRSTIINSSKEMSAFSDFPPDPELPNFMHNTKMLEYLEKYSNSFNFANYVKFKHEIMRIEQNFDYDVSGKWLITVKNLENGLIFEEVYDAVMVCSGHHIKPNIPQFVDQNLFKGQVIHSHSYKKPNGLENKRVVIIGIGNSGADITVETSNVAEKVYLSTRRGAWVASRVGINGWPVDTIFHIRIFQLLMKLIPYNISCSIFEFYFNTLFDHSKYQLKPKHRILEQHGLLTDSLPYKILSGQVIIKGDIERFTTNGLIFKGENKETLCDVVILATGYKIHFPFISQQIIPINNNRIDLYKNVFSPQLKHPKTLAFITLVQGNGAFLTIGEMQSRWFALLFNNKISLPSVEVMNKDIETNNRELSNKFYKSERHTIQVDWIPYMDDIALKIGVKPNFVKYFFIDHKLWRHLIFGPAVTYQYRLQGPHQWIGARNAILNVENRILKPLEMRKDLANNATNNQISVFSLFKILVLTLFLSYIFTKIYF